MARSDITVDLTEAAPASKSGMHARLTEALLNSPGPADGRPDDQVRLVVVVSAATALTVQARTMLLREFPASRPALRMVLRSRDGQPAGLLRAARAARVTVVRR
jgi:hypothetical protein